MNEGAVPPPPELTPAQGLVAITGPPGSGKTQRLEALVEGLQGRKGYAVLRLDHMYSGTQLEPLHVLKNFVACRNRLVHSGTARKIIVLDDYDGLAASDRGLPAAVGRALAHPAVTVITTLRNPALLRALPTPSAFIDCSSSSSSADAAEPCVDDVSAEAFMQLYENCAQMPTVTRKGIVDACAMEAVAVANMDWTLHKIANTLKHGFLKQCTSSKCLSSRRRLAQGGGKTHPSLAARSAFGIHPDDAIAWQTALDCGLIKKPVP